MLPSRSICRSLLSLLTLLLIQRERLEDMINAAAEEEEARVERDSVVPWAACDKCGKVVCVCVCVYVCVCVCVHVF